MNIIAMKISSAAKIIALGIASALLRENIELGREEGIELGREEGREEGAKNATKIIKLYNKGMDSTNISSSLQLDLEYVNFVITDYEKD